MSTSATRSATRLTCSSSVPDLLATALAGALFPDPVPHRWQGSFTSLRSGREAGVDGDDRAREGTGVGAAEPRYGRRDLAGLEQPAEQGLGGEGLLIGQVVDGGAGAEHGPAGGARADDVRRDPGAGQVGGQGADVADHRALGR